MLSIYSWTYLTNSIICSVISIWRYFKELIFWTETFMVFLAIAFDWHLFWPVEINSPQMIYNKPGPRAVWALYDRSGLCESASVCLSQRVSSLFPSPAPEVRQIRSHISFCGSHGSQKCTWPQGSCTGGFFFYFLYPALKGAAMTNACFTVSIMLLDIMKFHATWLDVCVD